MKRAFLVAAVSLQLASCSWFGAPKADDQQASTTAKPTLSSDDVLKRDCGSEQWKRENLGLWYSVCRQPMKW